MNAKLLVRLSVCLALAGLLLCAARAATNVVSIGSFFFSPTNTTINVGDTITWSNTVLIAHDSTRPNLWSSGPLGQGQQFSFTFTNTGSYPYFCAIHIVSHPEQTGTVSVVTAPNNPPTVLITNPPNNAVFAAPANVTIEASASDDVSVANVQFLVGSIVLGDDTTLPYSALTNGLPAGNYTLSAIASDNLGVTATNSISITVTNSPPSAITLLNPAFSGGVFRFSFATQTGYTYSAQLTPSLSSISWFTFTNLTGNGSVVQVTDSTSTNSQRFYRVGAQ